MVIKKTAAILFAMLFMYVLTACVYSSMYMSYPELTTEGLSFIGEGNYPIYLNKNKKEEIEKAWIATKGMPITWFGGDLFVGMRYYGEYDGYDILFYPTLSPTVMLTEVEIGGCLFRHSSTFKLYAYRNGSFRALDEAYEDGLISKESILGAYQAHKAFEIF